MAAAAIAVGLQRLSPHGRLKESWRTNLGVWCVNLVVTGAVCGACAFTVAKWARVAGVGLLTTLSAPLWVSVVVSMLVLDLVSCGWHRANHQVSLLWRFHRVHHSDTRFTVSTIFALWDRLFRTYRENTSIMEVETGFLAVRGRQAL